MLRFTSTSSGLKVLYFWSICIFLQASVMATCLCQISHEVTWQICSEQLQSCTLLRM